MDYNSLTAPKQTGGSIANWVNWSDQILPLPDILLDAQSYLWDRLRVTDMRALGSFTLKQSATTAAIPGGFNTPGGLLGVIVMLDNFQVEIKARNLTNVVNRQVFDSTGAPQQGAPSFYAISTAQNGQFVFDQAPQQDIVCTYAYYQQPLFLSVANPTNFLTNRYPHLLRRACLVMAADYLNDDAKFARYAQMLGDMLTSVGQSDDMAMEGMQIDPDFTESRF